MHGYVSMHAYTCKNILGVLYSKSADYSTPRSQRSTCRSCNFPFHSVGPSDGVQVLPGDNCLYLLSHLEGSLREFFKAKRKCINFVCVPKDETHSFILILLH